MPKIIPKWRPWTCKNCGERGWINLAMRFTPCVGCSHVQDLRELTHAELEACEAAWQEFCAADRAKGTAP